MTPQQQAEILAVADTLDRFNLKRTANRLRAVLGEQPDDERPCAIQDRDGGVAAIPWGLAEILYVAYASRGHRGQSLQHLHERGGFSRRELGMLAVDCYGGSERMRPSLKRMPLLDLYDMARRAPNAAIPHPADPDQGPHGCTCGVDATKQRFADAVAESLDTVRDQAVQQERERLTARKVELLHPYDHPELGAQMRVEPALAGGYVRSTDLPAIIEQARQEWEAGVGESVRLAEEKGRRQARQKEREKVRGRLAKVPSHGGVVPVAGLEAALDSLDSDRGGEDR